MPRRGAGRYVQKVWPHPQKQRPKETKRVRAEDLKKPRRTMANKEASHKGERNASGTKKQKNKKNTQQWHPDPYVPTKSVPVS